MTHTPKRPDIGGTYWAALADPGPEWTTVYGSYYGALVDPDLDWTGYGAALFTTCEDALAYRVVHGPVPGCPARVVYNGGTFYRTAR